MVRSSISCAVLALAIVRAGVSSAQDAPEPKPFHPFVVGAYAGLGLAHTFADFPDDQPYGWKPRFAGGGGAYFDLYVAKNWAIGIGLGLAGKGARHGTTDSGTRRRILCLEVPIGALLDVRGFRAGVALGLSVALYGIDVEIADGRAAPDGSQPWGENEAMNEWDYYRRLNLCPRLTLAYAVPVGKIAIVPGIAWSIEILDDVKGDAESDGIFWAKESRNMNLMFNLGLEYGFGGGK